MVFIFVTSFIIKLTTEIEITCCIQIYIVLIIDLCGIVILLDVCIACVAVSGIIMPLFPFFTIRLGVSFLSTLTKFYWLVVDLFPTSYSVGFSKG